MTNMFTWIAPLRASQYSVILFLLFALSACGRKAVDSTIVVNGEKLDDQQVSSLETKKIFFGHQSVGSDIVQGIRDLMAEDPRLKLNVVRSADPESIPAPAFVETTIGENRKPQSKNADFAAVLAKGMGAQGGVAMYKYCYIDVDLATDVQQLFDNYRDEVSALKSQYPGLTIVHITVPLTTLDMDMKSWVKVLLGRPTVRDVAAKRNEFNKLLRQTYSGKDPIFDLAEVESTLPDGTRSYFTRGDQQIYTLAPDLTTDGGHLNAMGRRAAATRLLRVLADL
jgi:hypothetical protein